MLLTVITPDTQTAMVRMLERELKDIDHEIVKRTWQTGIPLAKGNFVCLLERNSAITADAIRQNLAVFIDNPSYRKLAMVSPAVDLACQPVLQPLMLGFKNGMTIQTTKGYRGVKSARIGCAGGAIIRRSSLLKANVPVTNNIEIYSHNLSVEFWKNGLRVSANPDTCYYEPEKKKDDNNSSLIDVPQEVVDMWEHELIS